MLTRTAAIAQHKMINDAGSTVERDFNGGHGDDWQVSDDRLRKVDYVVKSTDLNPVSQHAKIRRKKGKVMLAMTGARAIWRDFPGGWQRLASGAGTRFLRRPARR